MLEEYRKHKQEKQFKLEERAVRDGRPFSAPVASPSCDDIKKRQLDSRALKETLPGAPQHAHKSNLQEYDSDWSHTLTL